MSAPSDTDRMIDFIDSPEGAELVVPFLADMGGDPEEYGVADVAAVTPEQIGVGFKDFLQLSLQSPELTVLVASEDVDWARVVSHLESNLSRYFSL